MNVRARHWERSRDRMLVLPLLVLAARALAVFVFGFEVTRYVAGSAA